MVSISTSVDTRDGEGQYYLKVELFFLNVLLILHIKIRQSNRKQKSEEKREHLNQTGQNFSGTVLFDEIVMSIK